MDELNKYLYGDIVVADEEFTTEYLYLQERGFIEKINTEYKYT